MSPLFCAFEDASAYVLILEYVDGVNMSDLSETQVQNGFERDRDPPS